jgi:FAD:protein FMN transferase
MGCRPYCKKILGIESISMRILSTTAASALALALAMSVSSSVNNRRLFHFGYDNVLGTSLDLKVAASSNEEAHKAESAVLDEISRESGILSSWDRNSEFSRWTRTHDQAIKVSDDLFRVLSMYDDWRGRTNGALDASAQSVLLAWQTAAAANRLPTREELSAAVAQTRQKQWALDPSARTATHTGNAPLVLASFTKSYIIDRAASAAIRAGVQGVVVNIGGDVAVRGTLVEPVDVADPRASEENAAPLSQIVLHDHAIATSGDYRRGFNIAGLHYSHIVDPRTGMPADKIISSAVTAPNPADAGALATAFSILKPEECAKLAATVPGASYLLVKKDGQQIRSANWGALEAPVAPVKLAAALVRPPLARLVFAPAPAVAGGSEWDPSMELTVSFDIAQPPGMAKRPFVIVWVEDTDHFQVKTIALWYHEDRYLPEMKAWYRSDRVRAMAEGRDIVRTVSSATRGPGKYSLKWDGKDNAGRTVKAGKYTVFLEVDREHGTYQLMKQEMDFSGIPTLVHFPANTEVAAASFDYHKLAAK